MYGQSEGGQADHKKGGKDEGRRGESDEMGFRNAMDRVIRGTDEAQKKVERFFCAFVGRKIFVTPNMLRGKS